VNTSGVQTGYSRETEKGFTLPEVLITIVIMGILAGIAVPSWFGIIESRRVDSATNQVLADLRLAHTTATNRLGEARVRFNSTGGSTVTCNGQQADYCFVEPIASGTVERPRNFESDAVQLESPNIIAAGGIMTLRFQADGQSNAPFGAGVTSVTDKCPGSTPSGIARIQVASTGDSPMAHCMTIDPVTSRIKVD